MTIEKKRDNVKERAAAKERQAAKERPTNKERPLAKERPQHKERADGSGSRPGVKHSTAVSNKQPPQRGAEHNSDDEYEGGFKNDELDLCFIASMKDVHGFNVKIVQGDGACMFRAVADQIYGDEEMHHDVRRLCMDYILKNRDHYSQFMTEDFNEYLTRKRNSDEHGNHIELQAISEIFLRPIEIYEYHTEPINVFHPISPEANSGRPNPPIRLSYHGNVHYNSVVDPYTPTIGVGLGLPGHQPGAADRSLLSEAAQASEREQIEETMLREKLSATDWEQTEKEIQRQVAYESYMEYLKKSERSTTERRRSPSKSPKS